MVVSCYIQTKSRDLIYVQQCSSNYNDKISNVAESNKIKYMQESKITLLILQFKVQ